MIFNIIVAILTILIIVFLIYNFISYKENVEKDLEEAYKNLLDTFDEFNNKK